MFSRIAPSQEERPRVLSLSILHINFISRIHHQTKMPQYKLMYFNARGVAEPSRMLFALKGQDFEDCRFKEGEWPGELKGNADLFPLGQAPVLLIDGKPLPHSRAIARHLAREFGLYGDNNAETAQIDVLTETADDIRSKAFAVHFNTDEAKKAEAMADFRDNGSKIPLTFFNNYIKKAGGKHFVGKSATLADVYIFATMEYIFGMFGKTYAIETYPDLAKFCKGLKENSPLTSYIASRPKDQK